MLTYHTVTQSARPIFYWYHWLFDETFTLCELKKEKQLHGKVDNAPSDLVVAITCILVTKKAFQGYYEPSADIPVGVETFFCSCDFSAELTIHKGCFSSYLLQSYQSQFSNTSCCTSLIQKK